MQFQRRSSVYGVNAVSIGHGQRKHDSPWYLLYTINFAVPIAGQKERACGNRLSPQQINISVLIIARGKEKSNGNYKDQ